MCVDCMLLFSLVGLLHEAVVWLSLSVLGCTCADLLCTRLSVGRVVVACGCPLVAFCCTLSDDRCLWFHVNGSWLYFTVFRCVWLFFCAACGCLFVVFGCIGVHLLVYLSRVVV